MDVSCKYAYVDTNGAKIQNGFKLQDPYYERAYPQLDIMMAKCGVRLASILNSLYSSVDPPPPPQFGPAYLIFFMRFAYSDVIAAAESFAVELIRDIATATGTNSTRLNLFRVQPGPVSDMVLVEIEVLDSTGEPGIVRANRLMSAFNDPASDVFLQDYTSSSRVMTGSASAQSTPPADTTHVEVIEKDGPLNAGLVAGLVLGLAAVVGIGLFGLWWILNHRPQHCSDNFNRMKSEPLHDVEFGHSPSAPSNITPHATRPSPPPPPPPPVTAHVHAS